MGIWSMVATLLEAWAPPQDSGEVKVMPKVVEILHKIGKSLEKQSALFMA